MHPSLVRFLLTKDDSFELRPQGRGGPLNQEALRGFAEVDVRTVQPFDQLVVAFLVEVEFARTRRVLVPNAVEAAAFTVDSRRVPIGVLVTVVAVVPVEDVQAALGSHLL